MPRMNVITRLKYGIDLGTTNSAICKMEHGELKIIKTTTQKDTLPSFVAFTRNGKIIVGDKAVAQLNNDRIQSVRSDTEIGQNVFIEFKRTMGLDTQYHSRNMELKGEKSDFNSEELSAEVLKELKSIASNASDNERINGVVVTIPARFSAQQSEATLRAAKLAGFQNCFLLQEPVAAATAYAYATNCKNGYWLVFDFGGGTFDAALLDVRDGVMTVVDTGGDAHLGGKNLDYAIVDELLLPKLRRQYSLDILLSDKTKKQRLREVLKPKAEEFKNELSMQETWELIDDFFSIGEDDNGNEITLNISLSQNELKSVFAPLFQNAIDMCKDLLGRNNLNSDKLDKLILVGGPTHSPILRQMLKEQITRNLDTSVDPMTAVAKGAAIYAATTEERIDLPYEEGDDGEHPTASILLDIKYNSGAVREKVPVSIMMANPNEIRAFFVQLCRPDGTWSSEKMVIGEGAVVQCLLDLSKKSNTFTVKLSDDRGNTYSCDPNEIVFMNVKPPTQVLAYNIGVEIMDLERDRAVFMPIKGLEKNQPTRAEGEKAGLCTMCDIIPGDETSKVTIPIYEGDNNTEGTSTIYNKHVFDVELTGDDVPELIPRNSEITIKIVVEKDMTKKLFASFPKFGLSIEKRIEIGTSSSVSVIELKRKFDDAKSRLESFQNSGVIPDEEISSAASKLAEIERRFEAETQQDDGKEHLLESLRDVFRKLEEVEKHHEWDTLESELRHEFDRLEKANNDLGNKHDQEVNELRRQTDTVIRSRDVKMGRKVLKAIEDVFVQVTFIYQLMGCIEHYDRNFGRCEWRNANQARQLLSQGKDMIASGNINEQRLLGICHDVLNLLPEDERNSGPGLGM